jgi:hypothetical protein
MAFVLSALSLAVGAAGSLADSSAPRSGPFAQFRACMKANGAPTLGRHQGDGDKGKSGSHARGAKLSDADRAALKKAFAACKGLLPQKTAGDRGNKSGQTFVLPTAAQVSAFKACMASKGFSRDQAGASKRPDFRDPAVRSAFKAALAACWPLLKPASTG